MIFKSEMHVPVWMIADIYINGKNLILHLYGYEDEKQLYKDIVGATIPSMLRDFYYKPYRVKTAWLYECSGCYRCYPVETDVYFLSNFVVWRYFHFPYSVKKNHFDFPLGGVPKRLRNPKGVGKGYRNRP